MSERPSKYALARQCVKELCDRAPAAGVTAEEILETLIVVTIEEMSKQGGRKRAADVLRYELGNLGGDIDTVFLRSR
jgi:hypothetical protein